MGLDIALDALYATGWSALDSTGCTHHSDGRAFPTLARIRQEFEAAGYRFTVTRVDQFNCYRAEWVSEDGSDSGAVVGHAEAEAAVYALAQFRRQLVGAGV